MKKLIYYTSILLIFLPFVKICAQDLLFPHIDGWKLEINEEVYNANNLWDIIDGAADLYLEYSFEDLHIARYYSDNTEVKVELYRFKSPLNAFGMYSQEKDLNYKFVDIGINGYIDNEILNFVSGVYYIKLYAYQTNSETQSNLLLIAKKIDEHLKQNNSLPEIYNVFPKEYLIKNSEQYISRNFLGYSFLNSVALVLYKLPIDITIKAFVIKNTNEEIANNLLKSYLNAMNKENVIKLNDNIYISETSSYKLIIGLQKNYLFGLIDDTKKADYQLLLDKLRENLLSD